jgi:Protein of unknown function (DUF2950)
MVVGGVPTTTSQSTTTTISSATRTARMSTTDHLRGRVVATTGSTIRNIGVAHRTRTAQPQIDMEEPRAVIPWGTVSRMVGRIRANGTIGNEITPIEVPGADNNRATEVTEAEGQAGNSRARIEAAEERTEWGIDKFRIRRAGRTRALSVGPRRGRAEARPEPAANAVLPAWEVREAALEVVAAGGEGRRTMIEDRHMTSNYSNAVTKTASVAVLLIAVFCALPLRSQAQEQSKSSSTESSPQAQKTFDSPQQAANALITASDQFDAPSLMQIFGPAGADFVASADPVEDKKTAIAFAAKAHEKNSVQVDPKNPNRAVLIVGTEEWPFPIPIVKTNGMWRFDTNAGKREILLRRIGSNELDAITICRGYVEAQLEYASQIHDDSGVNEYAQRIISTPGKHDGLAWQNADGSWSGPVGEEVAKALAEGYGEKRPFHGYYFRLLEGQGQHARLGRLNYFVEGVMIGGFAIVAWPADYRVTGVQTFIVSYDGIVYQKDLGADTSKVASTMQLYNPDSTWHRTDDNW